MKGSRRTQKCSTLAGGILELRVIPATTEVVGADKADVLIPCFAQVEEGLILSVTEIGTDIDHLLQVVLVVLLVASCAQREDAKREILITEGLAPLLDHDGHDIGIHAGSI